MIMKKNKIKMPSQKQKVRISQELLDESREYMKYVIS